MAHKLTVPNGRHGRDDGRMAAIRVGSKIRYRLADSIDIREAIVLDIETWPATRAGSYVIVPSYSVYVARDTRNGWVQRLRDGDLR